MFELAPTAFEFRYLLLLAKRVLAAAILVAEFELGWFAELRTWLEVYSILRSKVRTTELLPLWRRVNEFSIIGGWLFLWDLCRYWAPTRAAAAAVPTALFVYSSSLL